MKTFEELWADEDKPFWRGGSHMEKEICEYFFNLGQQTPPTITDKMLMGIEQDRIRKERTKR